MKALDIRMAKAISHPVRAEALRILNEREASPSDIARDLGKPVATVSYHVNTLLRLGCVEETQHRHVRGSIEHFYRAVRPSTIDRPAVAALPESVRRSFAGTIVENAMDDVVGALGAGTIEGRDDMHLSFTKLTLDDEGWDQVYGVLRDALAKVQDVNESARQRIEDGAEGSTPARLTIMFYEAPEQA